MVRQYACTCMLFSGLFCVFGYSQGLTTKTWPAGTVVGKAEQSRLHTYHRGYIYSPSADNNTKSYVWDISDPENPKKVFTGKGSNGHNWVKIGDRFDREFSELNLKEINNKNGTDFLFLSLAELPNLTGYSKPGFYAVDNSEDKPRPRTLWTLPFEFRVVKKDLRTGFDLDFKFSDSINVRAGKRALMGNLLFFVPGDGGDMAIFDMSDPARPRVLDEFIGDVSSYSSQRNFYKSAFFALPGKMMPDGNRAPSLLDFSDPTNIRLTQSFPNVPGRYCHFQDEHVFSTRGTKIHKVNMETGNLDLEISWKKEDWGGSGDFQCLPLGHLVFTANGQIATHLDGLDQTAPRVGYQLPAKDEKNWSIYSNISFVINETLDDTTVNNRNFLLRPRGGDPVEAEVVRYSYDIISIVPNQPLEENTEYEVEIVGGKVKDVAGNAMEEYSFTFRTSSIDFLKKAPAIARLEMVEAESPLLVGSQARFCAEAKQPESKELMFRWDFNEAENQDVEWLTGGEGNIKQCVTHTFTKKGAFIVEFKVKNDLGQAVSKSIPVNVFNKVAGRPQQATPIIVDEENRRVWVVNPDNNSVTVIDPDDLSFKKEINTCKKPVSVALDHASNAWITCEDSDAVWIINGTTMQFKNSIYLGRGSAPVNIAYDFRDKRAYVINHGTGKLVQIDGISMQPNGSLEVCPKPRGMAISPDGKKMLISRFVSSDEGGEIHEIDLGTLSIDRMFTIEIDSETADDDAAARGLANYLQAVAYHPDGQTAWFASKKDNILRGKNRDGEPLTFETAVRTMVGELDFEKSRENKRGRFDIDNSSQPSAMVFTPYGTHAFLTLQGNDSLVAINPKVRAGVKVGKAPNGVVVDRVTERIFTKDYMSRTVTVIEASEFIRFGNGELTVIDTIQTVSNEELDPNVLRGKQLFYSADSLMSLDGYISCAVCHLDGGDDGRTWDFTDRGEGLRNTISLQGRQGTGHGPLHWTANFDEVQDFENDIRNHFQGLGFLTDPDWGELSNTLGDPKRGKSTDLDALAAYVSSLDKFPPSPFRNDDGRMTQMALEGEKIFNRTDVGCATCHNPATDYTDSDLNAVKSGSPNLHNVGTITASSGNRLGGELPGFDTPTLLGVWETAPYLHDGSAATIKDVIITHNPDDMHGKTSHLSDTEINQLVAFLQQLDGGEDTRSNPVVNAGKKLQAGMQVVARSGNQFEFHVYGLGADGEFKLSLLDVKGVTKQSWDQKNFQYIPGQGKWVLVWENRSKKTSLSNGIYFAALEGREAKLTRKVLLGMGK